ncbi:SGNH/GDSL hydrolase family protein [Archangium sp.]|uniref:SGNH/GDSL hydrolase family protein n=1 Tax=Archangium sp. TaxID=1872627 RepID=UPI002D40F8B3|nr:SGNH/GDSL hydrolase family protein [Archangium sp.]HYO55974.1 SGNH/GDSL hydrolase family protein [Archangium sp.]
MALHTANAMEPATSEEARAGLEKLSRRRVFFGHQSVGGNLLDGVRQLSSPGSPAPRIVEVSDPSTPLAPGTLAHAMVGHNEQPETKIAHFEKLVDGGMAKGADVAFFKFCYIDFNSATDAKALFEKYRATLAGLKARHPGVTFVHATVPLTTVQRGAKAWLKEWMGRPVWGVGENVTREAFNALLRQTYAGKEPLFDLAALESTRPDGTPETYELNGRSYPAMVPEYSDDGGHLNAAGQARLASAFVSFLATLPEPSQVAAPTSQAVP